MAKIVPVTSPIPIDLNNMNEVNVGPAETFRQDVNDDLNTLASAAQQLENQVGPYDWNSNNTINIGSEGKTWVPDNLGNKIFGSSKVFVGTVEEYQDAVKNKNMTFEVGDIWIRTVQK